MRVSIADIGAALHIAAFAEMTGEVCAVVTDSRKAVPGALFVCVPGERVDGHDFAAAAVERGAVALLAQRPLSVTDGNGREVPVFVVPDTVEALGRLARWWRDRTSAVVVGVTGTAGKTTVKEVLAQVLSVRGKTARNELNLNNQIGMPLSMLAADGDEAFWVMEAGISHEGDMEALGAVLHPDLALILNVGAGHTAGLGKKGVAWHKTRLLAALAEGGRALVSADYPDLAREARAVVGATQFFTAEGRPLRYSGAYTGHQENGRGVYRLRLDGEACDVQAPFVGGYGAENAIAIAAAAHMLGLSGAEIAQGFAAASLPPQRFTRRQCGAWTVIDDSYNANPLSMRRMLEAASEAAGGRTFVAVLGEMLELGDLADKEHETLGRELADMRPAAVLWKGGRFEALCSGLERGHYAGPVAQVDDEASLAAALEQCGCSPSQGGLALFKGSRGNHLETLAAAFAVWAQGRE